MKKVIFYTSWTDPTTYLEETLKRLTPENDGRWRTIMGTDKPEEADYAVILDDLQEDIPFPASRRIFLQREPPEIRPKTLDTTGWKFNGCYNKGWHHISVPWILRPFNELDNFEYEPRDQQKPIVAICSNKTKTVGQRKRLELLKKLCQQKPELVDVYGRGLNPADFNGCYKGTIESKCKFDTLRQYQYCLACENSSHNNYFTEKIVDCFLSLTVPIYWGCPNLSEFFPKDSYYQLENLDNNNIDKICSIAESAPENNIIEKVKYARYRVLYHWNIWPTLHTVLTLHKFYGQFGQDKRVYELFFKNYSKPGVFVEVGASDGITFSNTFFFENTLGWKGLCIEPRPSACKELVKNRDCHMLRCAVGDPGDFLRPETYGVEFQELEGWGSGLSGIKKYYDPRHLERIRQEELHPKHKGKQNIMVAFRSLSYALERFSLYDIDYMSIDIEGGEMKVLKSLDYDRFRIKVLDVENNYRTADIRNFLKTKGYRFVERIGVDEIHVRDDLF